MSDLRKLAEAATPGPWRVSELGDACDFYIVHGAPNDPDEQYLCMDATRDDAEFIAACDPQTVIHLIDDRDRYRAALEDIAVQPERLAPMIAREALNPPQDAA